MSDGFSIKALREREVVRPESHSVTRFEPFVCVPEDEWLALLDAVEAAQVYLKAEDDHPDLGQFFLNWLAAQDRFDFGSEASR